ncbi:LD-carboxypeptidase [Vibrio sonorensis]|uniref:LD-carboxypeptidase n=1 Tax=Vibrio sonorensis TaxID=1004316 RepID=UPI000AC9B8F6|nr:LD-carboxypeptidase [Vibrio sonorensis]
MSRIMYPSPLTKGDKIAITAPSSGVPTKVHERLDKVLNFLRLQGFEVVEGNCLRENHQHVSASAEKRAEELMSFLTDDSISAVMPPWGGEFAMDLLPLLDFEKLKNTRPKWISGYSDTSTILTAITTLAGWATLHGTTLMERHPNQEDDLSQSMMFAHTLKAGDSILLQASTHYQKQGKPFAEYPDWTFNLTEKTQWKRTGLKHGAFSGRLIGGCFDIMLT